MRSPAYHPDAARAILDQIAPPPDLFTSAMTVTTPDRCACGEALEMEMEIGLGECVNCQAEAAWLSGGRRMA
jgi:hypothetical protein